MFTTKLPKFCWICGHKFWGNKIYVIWKCYPDHEGEGPRYVHKACGEKENYNVHKLPVKVSKSSGRKI